MLGQGPDTVLVKRGTSGSLQVTNDAGPLIQAMFPVEKVRRLQYYLLPHDQIVTSTRCCQSV